jgi:hypothetical protein
VVCEMVRDGYSRGDMPHSSSLGRTAPHVPLADHDAHILTIIPTQPQGFFNVTTPIRTTVVQLKDGRLWVHAPVAPTRECMRLLGEIGGEVAYIVLPTTAFEHKASTHPKGYTGGCGNAQLVDRRVESCRCAAHSPHFPANHSSTHPPPLSNVTGLRRRLCQGLPQGPGLRLRGPVGMASQPAPALPRQFLHHGGQPTNTMGRRDRTRPLAPAHDRDRPRQ